VDVIARLISEWYLGLAPEAQAAFVAEALRVGSFMGEVNRSDSEHIIAIPKYGTPCTALMRLLLLLLLFVCLLVCLLLSLLLLLLCVCEHDVLLEPLP
jgi:hypothetical protein